MADIADTPIADTPIADTPIADTPIADTPIADLHTLERKKRWSRGGEMGRGEKWERAGGGGERNGG